MTFKDLDAKMRVYEQSLDQIIPPENYLLARIDGRSFTRLTNQELVADHFSWPMEDAHRNCLNSWCYWTGHNPITGQDVPTTRREVFVDYDLPREFVPFCYKSFLTNKPINNQNK